MTSQPPSRAPRSLRPRTTKIISPKSRVDTLVCVCDGSSKDDRKIGCELCDNWYHFDCVNLTPAKAEEISIYVCDSCHLKTGKRLLFKWEGTDPDSYLLEATKRPQKTSLSIHRPRHPDVVVSSSDQESDMDEDRGDDQHSLESDVPLESEDSSTDFSNSDKGNTPINGSRKRSTRVRRQISILSSGSTSDDDSQNISRVGQDTATQRPRPKRKANVQNKPAKRPRIADPHTHSAADDPARKYCLAQLQNVLNPIFEEYAPQNQFKEKAKVGDSTPATTYANAVESHLFQTFSEPDRSGSQAVGQKYKAQFRMLTFNLEKQDRVVLRQRIGSGLLSASELSIMSNADLASEQQKKEMETAQKESLQHSILETRGTDRPLRKITHKGEEVIEDLNMDDELARVRASVVEDEPDRIVRIPAVNAPLDLTTQQNIISPKSPIHAIHENFSPISPTEPKSQESQVFHRARMIPSVTKDLPPQVSQETGESAFETTPSSPIGLNYKAGSTDLSSTENSFNATGSEFVSDSQTDASSASIRFDLNSIAWSSSAAVSSTIESDVYDRESGLSGPDLAVGDVDFAVDATDDHDFNMFLDEQTPSNPLPKALGSPTVWTGEIHMPSPLIRCAVDARLVAGRHPDFSDPAFWGSLFVAPSLNVEGRVTVPASSAYLLDSRLNSGRELVAVEFEPRQESERADFNQLVDYLLVKERHALVFPWGAAPPPDAPGKELYLVPLLPDAAIPEYLMMLDYISFPAVRTAVVLIGLFILHKTKKPTRHSNLNTSINSAPTYLSPNPPTLPSGVGFDLSALTPEFIADLLKNNPTIGAAAAAAFSPTVSPSYHDALPAVPAPYNHSYPLAPNMTAPSLSRYPPFPPPDSSAPRYIGRSPEHDRGRRESYESPRARGRGRGGAGGSGGGHNLGARSPPAFGPVDNGWASRRRGRGRGGALGRGSF